MKILIDIGHPAHVHYFKNFISIMHKNGHKVYLTARNREHIFNLLGFYNIEYVNRGKGSFKFLGKLLYFPKAEFIIYNIARKFNVDIFMGFANPYVTHIAKLLNKPVIILDDTESATISHFLYTRFADVILSPDCFGKYLSTKQHMIRSYFELFYLHPNYFKPDPSIFELLGINAKQKYVILRFVVWGGIHDYGHQGISLENKKKIVNDLSKYAKVFISSEENIPDIFQPYRINIPSHRMHDALSHATLFFGESATMASECAVLGTPAVYLDDEGRGYTTEQEQKYGLVYNFSESEEDQEKAINKAIELLNISSLEEEWQKRRLKMLEDKIDITAFMVWFIDNYPESFKIMKNDPDFQYNFS